MTISSEADKLAALDWERLFLQLHPRLCRFFLYRLEDADIAHELSAITFSKAWRARHQYRHDLGAFETWLFSIAKNVARDYLRQKQVRKEIPLDALWHYATDMNVEGESQKRQSIEQLTKVLQRLPQTQREIIALKYGANMTNRAIAKHLGLSESNVGTLIYRSLRFLRQIWDL